MRFFELPFDSVGITFTTLTDIFGPQSYRIRSNNAK